jgi:peptidoglycan DL-endopeptidase CwlO
VKVIARYQHEVAGREHSLATETANLHSQVQEMAARKAAIESQIASLHQREANISADIKQMIAAEQRRQDAAAAAAAAAASGGGGGGSVSIPVPPSSTLGGQAVAIAMQYLGTPYVWGGASPSGFDCSGFTMYVYSQLGVSLPHNAMSQYGMGTPVPRDALEPGDLVFFDGLGHVGIYVGGNAFIHAPHTGDVVRISTATTTSAPAGSANRRAR